MEQLKVNDKRLAVTEPPTLPAEQSNDIVFAAIQKGYDPDLIEKMMNLAERNQANVARQAYHEAMAAFKANPPDIEKDRKVSFKAGGQMVQYTHASLANVTKKINAGLGEHGLSAAWNTVQAEKGITVTCTITHKLGHSESTSLTAAPDTSGTKNSIQAIGSTISYLERYTLLALTGLATHDMDNDGGEPEEYIDEKQVSQIRDYLDNYDVDEARFLKYMKAASVEKIPVSQFKVAIAALDSKRKAKEAQNDS